MRASLFQQREKILLILETEPNLIDVAVQPQDVIQFGFLNPTFYFVETYFRKESVQLSFSKLPKHMCFTMDWRKEQFMKFVHQNPLIFQAKLLFYWIPDEIIVMDPYEMDIGFHDVDSTSAGMKHAIVVEPSGEYIFSLEQKVVNYLPAPYDTKCTDYAKQRFRFHSTIYTKELCYEECRANVIQQSCGCLLQDYAFRHEMNDTACTHPTCVQKSRRKMVETCNKKCGKGCREYIYETKQSFWLTYNPEVEGEYYIRLKFLMTSRSVDVMHIIPLIQGTQILGIIGGYLGLWLGLSIYLILYATAKWILGSLRQKARSVLGRARQTVRTLAYSGCLVVCFYSVHLDYTSYQRFETTVVLQQSSMEGTKFPAVTVCNKEATNLSRICWEHTGKGCSTLDTVPILNNRLHIMKEIIKYSYPIENLVLDCVMKTTADTCEGFRCTNMWFIEYTFYKTGVCYTFDPSHSPIYRRCTEPWKYQVTFRLASEIEGGPAKEATISALVHDQKLFTGGISSSAMFRAGKTYILTAHQTDVISLETPYETQCTDYVRLTRIWNYTSDIIQPEECSEKCLADLWKSKCDCYPKLYSMKHVLKGNLCEYLSHLKCNDYMKSMNWLPDCQSQCTRPCRETRYSSLSFQTGTLPDYIKYPSKEMEISVIMGTTRRKIVQTLPRMLRSDLVTYISGHVSMWLGASLLQLIDIL
ncbi:unnamed protein product, partial [Ixodes pacificus]